MFDQLRHPLSSHGHKSSISTIKAQLGIELSRRIHTNDCRGIHALRKDLDIVEFEVPARTVRITLDDNGLGMLKTREVGVVPARLDRTC